jgi:hypothetical protein
MARCESRGAEARWKQAARGAGNKDVFLLGGEARVRVGAERRGREAGQGRCDMLLVVFGCLCRLRTPGVEPETAVRRQQLHKCAPPSAPRHKGFICRALCTHNVLIESHTNARSRFCLCVP